MALRSTLNTVESFREKVTNSKGLIISTCNMDPSGCACSAAMLKEGVLDADLLRLVVTLNDVKKDNHFAKVNAVRIVEDISDHIKEKSKQWQYICITGCIPFAINNIIKEFQEKKLDIDFKKSPIYVISSPHLEAFFLKNDKVLFDFLVEYLFFYKIKFEILFSGVNLNHPMNIGIPPLPNSILQESKKNVLPKHENYYGLVYMRCYGDLNLNFFRTYLQQVKNASKNKENSKIIMIAVKNDELKELFSLFAKSQYGITIEHKDRLPQDQFIQLMLEVIDREGVVAFDGVYSLNEAILLRKTANALFYHNKGEQNKDYCVQLVETIKHTQPRLCETAKVILGLSEQYDLLTNRETCKAVYVFLHELLQKSVEKFTAYMGRKHLVDDIDEKKITQSNTTNKSQDLIKVDVPSKPGLFNQEQGNIKFVIIEQLKRITGLNNWKKHSTLESGKAHITITDSAIDINAIKQHFENHQIPIKLGAVKDTKQPILIIDFTHISVNAIKQIPPIDSSNKVNLRLCQ